MSCDRQASVSLGSDMSTKQESKGIVQCERAPEVGELLLEFFSQ